MEASTQWRGQWEPLDADREFVAQQICDALGDNPEEFAPCHPGTVTVHLAIDGPLRTELVGKACCQCGKPYVALTGNADASKVTFTALT